MRNTDKGRMIQHPAANNPTNPVAHQKAIAAAMAMRDKKMGLGDYLMQSPSTSPIAVK